MTDNAVSWQRAVGVLKEDRVTDVTQVGEYYNFIAAIMVVPDCIKAVSYTHLTLPTKRIV